MEILASAPQMLAVRRGDLLVVINCGSRAARLPDAAGQLLLSSGADPVDGKLAPDTAAWFRER